MQEILPGLYHWSTFHEPIGREVSSYYWRQTGLIIDPKIPAEGLDALPGRPEQVVLTIGLHDRDAGAVAKAFDIPIRVSREAAERLHGQLDVEPFTAGEEIAPGATTIAIGQIAPDECALHLAVAEGALSFADGLINYGGIGFVPDFLLGDDPPAVKRGLREAFAGLLQRDFDHLLFAHGDPVVGSGKAALRAFVEQAGTG